MSATNLPTNRPRVVDRRLRPAYGRRLRATPEPRRIYAQPLPPITRGGQGRPAPAILEYAEAIAIATALLLVVVMVAIYCGRPM